MKQITHAELVSMLETQKGTCFVGLLTLSDARARKTNNPHFPIFKQVRSVGTVGANYENSVNREANRQDSKESFESGALPWGQWLINGKVITHKSEFYLRTQCTPNQRRTQAAKLLCYRDSSGKFLSPEIVKPFLPEKRESTKQQDVTGIEETVWVRTWAFSSIQKIRIQGQTFKLVK